MTLGDLYDHIKELDSCNAMLSAIASHPEYNGASKASRNMRLEYQDILSRVRELRNKPIG